MIIIPILFKLSIRRRNFLLGFEFIGNFITLDLFVTNLILLTSHPSFELKIKKKKSMERNFFFLDFS